MNNIYVLNKNYSKIGTLSNQGARPQAPYYEDLFVQELETGADTYQFSTISSPYTQDILEIGNHIMFTYKNRNELFTITSLEYSHNEGYKTIGVYAEGIGFDLLEVYMKRPENEKESSSDDSEGGRDEDGDGDTSTDDEYADLDDMYLDENGIIVYDKDGSGPPSEEDMYVDENGIIVYRRNKRNRKKDSLEFKNISYSRFLSILLKNTGWSYVCQPGLETIKHDITVRYDTNIFALLQDSMQSYRGVELEFVHELVGGKVQKVIKAYKDGGRGSFVGKRFEYGTNVRGITKTQEVANSEDDTILYIDNVGINVQYDVDFALKSAEVPEIEIGDTHYVIDRDFYPPMTIKARIGKIEISFSDPTVNKIYLANNKRISGSAIEDEFDADDVADMLDDYDFDDGNYDDGFVGDHTHDRLVSEIWAEYKQTSSDGSSMTTRWRPYVTLEGPYLVPDKASYYRLGSEDQPWFTLLTQKVDCFNSVNSPRYWGYDYQVHYDREDMEDVKLIDTGNISKQDLLNFVMNDLNVYEYSVTKINEVNNVQVDNPEGYFYDHRFGILSDDIVNHGATCHVSKVGDRITKGIVRSDTNNDGDKNNNDSHNGHIYSIPSLLCCLIGAFQYHVSGGTTSTNSPSNKDEDMGFGGGGDNPSTPGGDSGSGSTPGTGEGSGSGSYDKLIVDRLKAESIDATCYTGEIMQISYFIQTSELDVNDIIHTTRIVVDEYEDGGSPEIVVARGRYDSGYVDEPTTTIGTKITPDGITFPDGSTLTTANGSGGGSTPSNPGTGGGTIEGIPDDVFEYIQEENSMQWYGSEWLDINRTVHIDDNNLIVDGSLVVFGALEQIDYLYAKEADITTLRVNGTEINPAALVATASTDLSEYATVEALQEEIRAKDEQIASLEARLAKIEAMLGINNNDN